ncbi:MAG: aminotransferase class V-fold PLP-dependent enzyme [Phycisphaerales bacterium JB059]
MLERLPGARVNADTTPGARVWNTTNLLLPGVESEALLLALSERGLCASAGSACSSGSIEPSPVLLAMGLTESDARSSVRLSLSRLTTPEQIEEAVGLITECVERLRAQRA